jgi:hypothetical protein
MYLINVTDVSQLDFFIADTRQATPISFNGLSNGFLKQGGTGSLSTALTGYYPMNTIPFNNKAIAPRLLVASTFGGSFASGMRFESAVERCAGYQENGYPAGRWRLPTDAEIKFIANLSARGRIPTLFNGIFWGSSGESGNAIAVNPPDYHVLPDTPTDETEIYPVSVNIASIRCVYPLWNWGDHQFDGTDGYADYRTTWSGWQNN